MAEKVSPPLVLDLVLSRPRLTPLADLQKKALLDARRVGQNIDEAIDTLQACLRVLDLASKVQSLIENEKFFSALRVSSLPPDTSRLTLFMHLTLSTCRAAIGGSADDSSQARAALPVRVPHAVVYPDFAQRDPRVRHSITQSVDVRGEGGQSRGRQGSVGRHGGPRPAVGGAQEEGVECRAGQD